MSPRSSLMFIVLLLLALAVTLVGATSRAPVAEPDKLVILSTSDVKGKNEPCGCHIPKGGLSRRATFRDSLSAQYGQLLLVDAGGFFPEESDSLYRDKARFLMESMRALGTDAAALSERELKYGRGWLLANLKQSRLAMVCANVWDKQTKQTLVPATAIVKKGGVTVGVFGVTSDQADLGPARDSLTLESPEAAARRAVAELQKKGATVIVLLSQLGKVESEDLVSAVEGIDVAVLGRNVPVLQKGRMIKNTIACYGGEQGHYIGRTIVTLDTKRHMRTGENDVIVLGPEVNDKPAVLAMVKTFNDEWNDRSRRLEKERAARAKQQTGGETTSGTPGKADPDHFVGAEVCQRCHTNEYQQWLTTSHAKAWQTLVDVKRDATPECIVCHVVGYKQAGGFQRLDDATKLGNVQCENCHGMGTRHEAFVAENAARVTEATCRGCHTSTTSPAFDFAVFQPHIVHQRPAVLPTLPPNPAKAKMLGGTMH